MSQWAFRPKANMTNSREDQAPQTIRIAFWLFLLGAVAEITLCGLSLASAPAVIAAARSHAASITRGVGTKEAVQFVEPSILAGIFFGGLIGVALAVLSSLMLRGLRWARTALLVLTVISFSEITGSYGLGAVAFIASVIAMILAFRPPSKAFLRSRSKK